MTHSLLLAAHLAWRFLWKKHESSLNTMLKICICAIGLASCSLVLVVAIMNGFEHATHRQLQGIHSSLIMQSPAHDPLNVAKINEVITKEFPAIKHINPRSAAYAFLYTDEVEEPHFIQLRGIMPAFEHAESPLSNALVSPKKISLATLISEKNVVIGESLAALQGLRIGDSIHLFFAKRDQRSQKSIALESITATIVGLYKTGIEEFDESVIIAHHDLLEEYWDAPITALGITLQNSASEEVTMQALKKRFKLHVYSWKEMYPALVSALQLEKIASILILLLIIFIASMTIISVIYMLITSKRKDIAILHVLGAQPPLIRLIFLTIGLYITGIGTFSGIASGVLIVILLKYCVPIKLPAIYYSTHLPLELSIFNSIYITILSIAICLTAILFSLRSLRGIKIIEILKNE